MKNRAFILTSILLGFTSIITGQSKKELEKLDIIEASTLEPKGIYATIDIKRHNKFIENLNGNDKKIIQETVDSILKNPNYYNPPVLFALSKELFNENKLDAASFWYYTAQLRARYDANLCLDNTAKQGVATLNNKYGPNINNYAFKDPNNLEKIINNVLDFVKNNEENYDHRWLNLYGVEATMASINNDSDIDNKQMTEPKEKWVEIKKNTIETYTNGFKEYVKKLKKE